jgi:hypothetical protein
VGSVPAPAPDPVLPAAAPNEGVTGTAPASTPAAGGPAAVPSPAPAQRAAPIRLEPPRASLLPLAQPLWSELTPAQQQVLAPFASQWNSLPISEKRAWADLASRFPKMKPDTRTRVERRIAEWAELTPEQRRLARANYRLAKRIARENLLAEWESYQAMTPDQRSVLDSAAGTSNTAARHLGNATGLARHAAQPLPRRAPVVAGADGTTVPAAGVTPTVGPAGTSRP